MYEELFNQLRNHSNSQKASRTRQASYFSLRQSDLFKQKNAKKATSLIAGSTRDIKSQLKKYSKGLLPKTEDIISKSISDLTTFHFGTNATYISIVSTFGQSLIDDATKNINNTTSQIIAGGGGLPQGTIDALNADAASHIADITSAIQSTINASIDNFLADSVKDLNVDTAKLDSLINLITGPALPAADVNLLTGKTTLKNNFYQRDSGNASTSRYIQANVPTKNGKLTPNASVLNSTPDGKILKPQLKTDINNVKSFATVPEFKMPTLPSLSSLVPATPSAPPMPAAPAVPAAPTVPSLSSLLDLGAIGKRFGLSTGLTPTATTKAISEPAPTSNKAEYGKIQVRETKGGFVEINDDTPGNVRKVQQHPSGSYTAMLNDGSVHKKVVADRQEITDGNWNIKTTKDKIEIVAGNEKIEIRFDSKRTILGNSDTNIESTQSTLVKKKVTNDFKSDFEEKIGGNSLLTINGNSDYKVAQNLKEKIGGNHQSNVGGNLTIKVTGSTNINTTGATTINSKGPATLSSASIVRISAPAIKLG